MLNIGKVFMPRNLRDHWLWDDAHKYQRWNDLVMEAAWTRTKFRFGNAKGWLERGQQVTSIRTLMHRWKTSSRYVTEFLADLESENMIKIETLTTHTIITIVDYDTYQGEAPEDETAVLETPPAEHIGKRIRQREGSQSKEDNNINNNNLNSSSLTVEEQNLKFVEEIKTNDLLMERAMTALRCGKEKVLELLDRFVSTSNFSSKSHTDFQDFRSHFVNWSMKYLINEQQNGNAKTKPAGGNSKDRYASRRGADAKDHTEEDYDSPF